MKDGKGHAMSRVTKRITLLIVMVGFLAPSPTYAQGEEAPDSMTGLKVGETVPDFTLKDQDGNEQSLKGLLAKEGTTALMFVRSANW